jgi:phosphoserine phosphatase RsbU/P
MACFPEPAKQFCPKPTQAFWVKMKEAPTDYNSGQKTESPFFRRLQATLHRIAVPAADYAKYALGLTDEGHTAWLSSHEVCACTHPWPESAETPAGMIRIELSPRNSPCGFVILCTIGRDPSLSSIICELIAESIRQTELEFEDEDLVRELASNWESLNTLYEISSDLRAVRNIPDILGRILDRMVAGRQNLHAVLWIEKDGLLEPGATTQADIASAREATAGLLGRAISGRTPVVINDPAKIRSIADLEPELLQAKKIALVPVATRDRLVGVLEAWQEQPAGEFDAPTIRLFEALALQAAMVIESDRAYRISIAEERLRKEFEIGGKIQETLLLGQPPENHPGLRIGVLTVPSRAVDGDFFDFLICGDDCLDLFIGDVMGKGVPAALVGAAAKSDLLKAFGQLTAANQIRELPAPQDIVTHVHQHLTSRLIDIERYLSLYYCRFDVRTRRVDFVDCGHPQAIHYRADQGTLELLAGDNMPLGVLEGGIYTQATAFFNPGDLFLFYSDGVTEATNEAGEFYGEERLKSLILANTNLEPFDLCAKIRESVAAFTNSQTVTDDLTCLSIKIGSLEEFLPSMRWTTEFNSQMEFLPALRAWIRGVCRCACPEDPKMADSLELAATETVSNIIRHAYEGVTDKKIVLDAQSLPDRMSIRITHWGKYFRPESAPELPDSVSEHGYGLFIISRVVDKVAYVEGRHGSHCVILEKLLKKAAEGETHMLAMIEKIGDVTAVRVKVGALDAGNEKRFKKEVISALEPNSQVVLDMSEVEFIDSSGLGVILSCYRHVSAANGSFRICCLSEQVRTLFELVRMHRIFDVYGSCEEAMLSFKK